MKIEINEKAIATVSAVIFTAIIIGAIAGAGGWLLGRAEVEEENVELPGAGIRIDFFGCWSSTDKINPVLLGGLHAAADPLGITVVDHFDEGDPVLGVSQVEMAIAAGTDGILIAAGFGEPLKTALEGAMASGIPVVEVVFETPELPHDVYVGPGSLVDYGYFRASKVDEYVPDGGKILYVTGTLGTAQQVQNLEGYEKWFDEQGKDVQIDLLESGWSLDVIQVAVAAKLAAVTDYDTVLCDGAVGTAGTYLAMRDDPNYGPGDAPIAGIDLQDVVIDGIRDGYVEGVVCWGPWQCLYMAVHQIYPRIKYGEYVPMQPVNTSMSWIDSSNLEDFLPYNDIIGC